MRVLLLLIYLIPVVPALAQQEGEDYLIKSIYFGGGSYYVDRYQIEELYHFIDSLPGALNHRVTIHSHTDNIGGAEFNQKLSELRSSMVLQVLERKGFLRAMMEIKDFGMFNPVYDNTTFEGRLKNRRVDVIFWPMPL